MNWWRFPQIENFKQAEQLYNSITPLRGPRAKQNIRPLGPRDRTYYQIIKLGRDEYTVTDQSWHFNYHQINPQYPISLVRESARLVSYKRNGEIVVYGRRSIQYNSHTNQYTLHKHDNFRYSVGTCDLVARVLPSGLGCVSYSGKVYVILPPLTDSLTLRYFRMQKAGLRLKKINGVWQVLNPRREYTYRITPQKKAKVLALLKPFRKYAETLWPMVDEETMRTVKDAFYPWEFQQGKQEAWSVLLGRNKTKWLGIVSMMKQATRKWDLTLQRYGYDTTPSFTALHNWLLKYKREEFRSGPVPLGTYVLKHRLERS